MREAWRNENLVEVVGEREGNRSLGRRDANYTVLKCHFRVECEVRWWNEVGWL